MKKQIIQTIIVLLIFIGITQLIGYFEIQHYDYKFKHEGRGDYGSGLVIPIILLVSCFGTLKMLPEEWKQNHFGLCNFLCFVFSLTLLFALVDHVSDKLIEIEKEALKDSYTTIGHITKKRTHKRRGSTDYYIWAGINEKTTSRYIVDKERYETSYVGAPVIMKVSRQYPCLNEILIWEPKPDDIDKYENKTTPPTADGSSVDK